MRSHFGCSVCKRRKLKCDEAKPVCGPCKKSSRACVFQVDAAFRIVSRPSADDRDVTGPNEQQISLRDTQVRIDAPDSFTFVPSSLSSDSRTLESPSKRRRMRRESLGASHDEETQGCEFVGSDGVSGLVIPTPSASSIDHDHGRQQESDWEPPRPCHADERVVALQLMRHFKEGPGQWMDLFDTGAYYSSKVPLRANSRPLLKTSVCALSAKHLNRIRSTSKYTCRDGWPAHFKMSDLSFYSAEYYRQAIGHLQAAAKSDKIDSASPSVARDRECIFTAVAILSMYELMDKPGTAWKAHLSALPLFSTTTADSAPASSTSERSPTICRPVFWSLARQDFLCAFISQTQTQLRLDDTQLWQSAGVDLGVSISVSASGPVVMGSATDDEEDKRANEMIWLLSNIISYLNRENAMVLNSNEHRRSMKRWMELDAELQGWFARLPGSFSPSARTPFVGQGSTQSDGEDSLAGLEQLWYDAPLCAAAMQSYHMARILLLVNRPRGSAAVESSVTARLGWYQYVLQESLRHAKEICGISLASPSDAVRLHSMEPLYVAGQVIRAPADRRLVLNLFDGIQRDMGWSTRHHVSKLQHEWHQEEEWLVDAGIS